MHGACRHVSLRATEEPLQDVKCGINSRADSRRRDEPPIIDDPRLRKNSRTAVQGPEFIDRGPVRRGTLALQKPSGAERSAPVQTESVSSAAPLAFRTNSSIAGRIISRLVPGPPGITRMSTSTKAAAVRVGTIRSPLRAVISPQRSAMVTTLNASEPSADLATPNTSNGPAKSSTSTSSKSKIATLLRSNLPSGPGAPCCGEFSVGNTHSTSNALPNTVCAH